MLDNIFPNKNVSKSFRALHDNFYTSDKKKYLTRSDEHKLEKEKLAVKEIPHKMLATYIAERRALVLC